MQINLISGPRNVSTALMYSFAQRSDCVVVDEPFYAYYLHTHPVDHPGLTDILHSQPLEWDKVMLRLPKRIDKPVLFLKNMAHHLIGNWQQLLDQSVNVFLIRDPARLIVSFAKVITHPTIDDIGLKKEYELFNYVKKQGKEVIVIDSGQLLLNPPAVLEKLCDALGLPFEDKMLAWPAGPKSYDGVWAPYWYATVHRSTDFKATPTEQAIEVPAHLQPLLAEALPYYKALADYAIKA